PLAGELPVRNDGNRPADVYARTPAADRGRPARVLHPRAPGDAARPDRGAALRLTLYRPSERGLPISQWCPKGSTIRPSRQPYSSLMGRTTVAPAATARSKAASGLSTTITMRTVPPPSDSGAKLKCSGDSSDTQNSASPTARRATTDPSLSTRNRS